MGRKKEFSLVSGDRICATLAPLLTQSAKSGGGPTLRVVKVIRLAAAGDKNPS